MLETVRSDPDALLAEMQVSDSKTRGRLKIFLGMCPGVGKTFAMLEAAHALQRKGVDIVVGIVETHGRAETQALLEGLEVLPRAKVIYRNAGLEEMDLDAILRRNPKIIIVDELAHSNAPGSRHLKRYQDVNEILDAGISVFTTLNIQHIESRVDVIRQMTQVIIRETVPDFFIDEADEVELVDLSPDQLRQRLAEGKVYFGERAEMAGNHFFKSENLIALRELALRYTAEKVDQELRHLLESRRIKGPWKAQERLLVAIGPTPFAESLIRWTRRQAGMLDCPWIALYVDSGVEQSEEIKNQLTRCFSLVRELGGEVTTVSGQEIVREVLRYARENHITQIVLGKSSASGWKRWLKLSYADKIIRESGSIDVLAVRPEKNWRPTLSSQPNFVTPKTNLKEWVWAGSIVVAVTLLGIFLRSFTGYWSISLIYLLSVVFSALKLSRWPVLTLALTSALTWNFLFIPPYYTFYISQLHDGLMFGIMLIVALVIGHLTTQLREREKRESLREKQTSTLLAFTAVLASQPDMNQALRESIQMMRDLFQVDICIFTRLNSSALKDNPVLGSTFIPDEKEKGVALWSYQNRQPAGKFTDTLTFSSCLHLPLFTSLLSVGVLLVRPNENRSFTISERSLLENFATQLGFVLQKEHVNEAMQKAEIAQRSSQLQKTLLDSVSHELKTPLTTLSLSAEALQKEKNMENIHSIAEEVTTATSRLHRIVNDLLDMTRLESGAIEPKLEWCDLKEVFADLLIQLKEIAPDRNISIKMDNNSLIKTDPALLSKALFNILHNATLYAPKTGAIFLEAVIEAEELMIKVRDQGPGLSEKALQQIFEKFYRGDENVSGGTGLGLSIAKGFVQALGGTIRATNATEGGALFILNVPIAISDEVPSK